MAWLIAASTLDTLAMIYVLGMTFTVCVAAMIKGRNVVLWTAGCLLLPPLLYLLFKKPATDKAGKVVCPLCDRWTEVRERCQHCRHEIDYDSFVE